MKKNVKLISALLILVMVLAQVVCINAASKDPSFSYSFKQVDHYEKEFTFTVKNPDKVAKVHASAYNFDGVKIDETVEANDIASGLDTISLTLSVRPNDCKFVRVWVQGDDGSELLKKEYTVGGNSNYNPGSSSSSSTGSYDGLVSSGSSNNYWTGSSSSSNVYDYYDPNKWYGYYEDKEDYEVKEYDYYYVTCRSLNVRNGAGTWADRVGSLKRYDKVKVYDIEKGWAVIEYKGRLRYVSARYLSEY